MRLWHEYLIPFLDNKRLIGQHRECCALRGKGWGKKHSTVDYVFEHHVVNLIQYHLLVINECIHRGFKIDRQWMDMHYRGKNTEPISESELDGSVYMKHLNMHALLNEKSDIYDVNYIYEEHNPRYLMECVTNLKNKNAELINGASLDEIILKLQLMGY